ncbi:uncharacterized protein [Halyomorpha halys]|uniref:uncharacterized protein n=1 Tax=Halyomorpha halys TaxID=286706 RepID=UPI0034D17D2F
MVFGSYIVIAVLSLNVGGFVNPYNRMVFYTFIVLAVLSLNVVGQYNVRNMSLIKRHARRPWRHWPPWKERQLTTVYYLATTRYDDSYLNFTTESPMTTETCPDWRIQTKPTTTDLFVPLKNNITTNRTELDFLEDSLFSTVPLSIVLVLIILATVVG